MHDFQVVGIFNSITVCMCIFPVMMSLCDYFICLSVFTWQKIDQAGGPEIKVFWLNNF